MRTTKKQVTNENGTMTYEWTNGMCKLTNKKGDVQHTFERAVVLAQRVAERLAMRGHNTQCTFNRRFKKVEVEADIELGKEMSTFDHLGYAGKEMRSHEYYSEYDKKVHTVRVCKFIWNVVE